MEAKLNLYADCTSEQPTKTYVCRRLIYKVAKKVGALMDHFDKSNEAEQERITIDVIKTIFPDFKDEEFEYVDPQEWFKFVTEITTETNDILENASKN